MTTPVPPLEPGTPYLTEGQRKALNAYDKAHVEPWCPGWVLTDEYCNRAIDWFNKKEEIPHAEVGDHPTDEQWEAINAWIKTYPGRVQVGRILTAKIANEAIDWFNEQERST